MKQTVVVIGASPLGYFISSALDQAVGNLAHTNLIWLTALGGVVHLPTTKGLLDRRTHPLSSLEFNDLKVRHTAVRSINLPERRIITTSGVLNYDQLIIDGWPTYQASELSAISGQLLTLLTSLRARPHRAGAARIYCQGQTAEAWQLALLIRGDITRHYPALISMVEVLVDLPGNHLGDWLRRNGLTKATDANLKKPGVRIHPPSPLVTARQIRGLQVGRDGSALVNAAHSPANFPEVKIFDGAWLKQLNLLRVWRGLARQVAAAVVARLDGRDQPALPVTTPALLLNSSQGSYLSLGDYENYRTRARLVARLDSHLRHRLHS